MSERENIEEYTLQEFAAFLLPRGFSPQKIVRVDARTRIDFFKNGFAVEVEIDWRDFMAFLLIVRLENGKLPEGYYVSNGEKCRKHLGNIIREQKWDETGELQAGCTIANPKNIEDLKNILQGYKQQLARFAEKLESSEVSVLMS